MGGGREAETALEALGGGAEGESEQRQDRGEDDPSMTWGSQKAPARWSLSRWSLSREAPGASFRSHAHSSPAWDHQQQSPGQEGSPAGPTVPVCSGLCRSAPRGWKGHCVLPLSPSRDGPSPHGLPDWVSRGRNTGWGPANPLAAFLPSPEKPHSFLTSGAV